MPAPVPNPIAELMLEDLRRVALFLDELGAAPDVARVHPATARAHATRLWSVTQGVERLLFAVQQLIIVQAGRRGVGES
jgi:hypothetical protein